MNIVHSNKVRPAEAAAQVSALIETVSECQLREWVERISVPRHFGAEPEQNRATAKWIHGLFDATFNYRFLRQVTQLLTACVIQQAEEDLVNDY